MKVRERVWTYKGKQRAAWVVDYTDANGKRRNKQFDTKREAQDWSAETRLDLKNGTHVADADTVTIDEAAKLWLETCRNPADEDEPLERSTTAQYDRHVRLHISPFIGSAKLNRFNAPDVLAFQTKLRAAGRSAAQVRKVTTSLGSIFADAEGRGLVNCNPVRAGRSKKKRSTASRHKKRLQPGVDIPTMDEARAMFKAGHGFWKAFVGVALFGGLRISELRGLRWQDISFTEGALKVEQRADAWGTIGSPKASASKRTIPLLPMVGTVLKEWRLACPRRDTGKVDKAGNPITELYLVFPTKTGRVLGHGEGVLRAGWHALQVAAGVTKPKIEDGVEVLDKDGNVVMEAKYPGFHAARHYFVSWCAASPKKGGRGLRPSEVQALAGHSTLAVTTDTYLHLFPDDDVTAEMRAAEAAFLSA